ncbi:phosphatidylglycerophosphatase A [Cereibacter sp. SYSU M97828]|nr:phosphatidylglycerophosphatase A [Cereibacter flavus]
MGMTRAICLLFGVGLLRPGPGTWGSAVALAAGIAIDRWLGFPVLVAATLAVTLIGWWALRAELGDTHDDPSEFVIDEVAGQWLALLFPAAAFWWRGMDMVWPGWVAAFIFFRLFDIWKPWLVGRADRRGDAWGVMADDLWAGVFAGIATIVAAGIAHGVLM